MGLPLALGFYEQLPLWAGFFEACGFTVVLSEESSRSLYFKGQHTVASDTACYPAKLTHGHIESLLDKGVDFIFYPETDRNADGIILELKVDHTPEEAIRQIREKNYALRFRQRLGERQRFSGRILAVGIGYNRKDKKHHCRVEVL